MASWLSNLLYGKDAGPSATEKAYNDSMTRRGNVSRQVEDDYLASDRAFDPAAALKEYSAGAIGDFHTALAKELGQLRDSSAAGGRLDSGFFDEDQGEIVTDLSSKLQNNLNQKALEVAGMKQRQIEGRGQYSLASGQDYNDQLAGQLDRETARENAKRQQRAATVGAVGSIAGLAFGGR